MKIATSMFDALKKEEAIIAYAEDILTPRTEPRDIVLATLEAMQMSIKELYLELECRGYVWDSAAGRWV